MKAFEQQLRALLTSRWRWHLVIISTLGLLLMVGLPAVDSYTRSRQKLVDLKVELEEAQQQSQRMATLRETVLDADDELAKFHARGVDPEKVHEFRTEIVKLTRDAGCQLRRLQLGNTTTRPWREGDHPLQASRQKDKKDKKAKVKYELTTQALTLSASGSMKQIKQLMQELQHTNKLMHTETLSLRSSGSQSQLVVMEIQLKLFGLEKAAKKSNKA